MRLLALKYLIIRGFSSSVGAYLTARSPPLTLEGIFGQEEVSASKLEYDRVLCDKELPPPGLIPSPYTPWDFTSLTDMCSLNSRVGNVGCGCPPLTAHEVAESSTVVCSDQGPYVNRHLHHWRDTRLYCEAYCVCKTKPQEILPQMTGRGRSGGVLYDMFLEDRTNTAAKKARAAKMRAVLDLNKAIWERHLLSPVKKRFQNRKQRRIGNNPGHCNILTRDFAEDSCSCTMKTLVGGGRVALCATSLGGG